jgi:hypothetical protein
VRVSVNLALSLPARGYEKDTVGYYYAILAAFVHEVFVAFQLTEGLAMVLLLDVVGLIQHVLSHIYLSICYKGVKFF